MTPTEAIGLFCAGSLVTFVVLLSLAWSRVSGFRIELGGLRLVDRDASAKDDRSVLRADLAGAISERDEARREAERMRELLEKTDGAR
jgi:hypothetical protein